MFGYRSLLLGFAFFAFSAGATVAQDAAPSGAEVPAATLKLNVRTVLVDVVVMDKEGHAVPGLTKDDFQVTENGAPQAIDFFEPHFAAAPGAAPTVPPLPPNTFTNVPATAPNEAVNVLLMDALNTQLADQMYVHKEMVRYLASIPPGIRIGIFLLSEKLRIIQGFTQDSAVLRASIARLAANPRSAPLLPSTSEMEAQSSAVNMLLDQPMGSGLTSAIALQDFMNEESNFEHNEQLLVTLDSLQTIAHYLAGVPGRKNLIWFVGSIPVCLPGVATSVLGCPFQEKYDKTIKMLAAARVSVYPISASGVVAPNGDISGQAQGQSSPLTTMAGADPLHSSLTGPPLPVGPFGDQSDLIERGIWAEKTGGKAFVRNDFKQELAEAIGDGSRYYTLAYTPGDRKEIGRERKIDVKVLSGKYKLFYRHSYDEETPKELRAAEAAPAKDPLRPLMDRGMPDFTELRYRITVAPVVPQPAPDAARAGGNADLKPPFTRYRVGFSLAMDGLTLVPGPDGVRRQTIEVALMAYSQAGKPLNWQVRSIGLAVRPEQMAIAQSSGIPFHFDFDAPPGDVYLRTGIYAFSSSRAGTLEIPLSSITVARK